MIRGCPREVPAATVNARPTRKEQPQGKHLHDAKRSPRVSNLSSGAVQGLREEPSLALTIPHATTPAAVPVPGVSKRLVGWMVQFSDCWQTTLYRPPA